MRTGPANSPEMRGRRRWEHRRRLHLPNRFDSDHGFEQRCGLGQRRSGVSRALDRGQLCHSWYRTVVRRNHPRSGVDHGYDRHQRTRPRTRPHGSSDVGQQCVHASVMSTATRHCGPGDDARHRNPSNRTGSRTAPAWCHTLCRGGHGRCDHLAPTPNRHHD